MFTVLGMLYFRILVVLMSVVSDDETQIGYYVTSSRVVEIAVGLPVLLVTVVLPVMSVAARDDRTRLSYVTARMTETMAIGGIVIALLISIGARPLILLVGGESYEPAATVLSIQAIALITIFVASAWSPTLISLGRTRELALVAAIGVVAVVSIGLVLIPKYEAEGAAITAVAADIVLCAATYVALRRAGPGKAVDPVALAKIALAGTRRGGAGLHPRGPRRPARAGCRVYVPGDRARARRHPGGAQDGVRAAISRLRRS